MISGNFEILETRMLSAKTGKVVPGFQTWSGGRFMWPAVETQEKAVARVHRMAEWDGFTVGKIWARKDGVPGSCREVYAP